MASMFDPLEMAYSVLLDMGPTLSLDMDYNRAHVRLPVTPGPLARKAAYQFHHDIHKWSNTDKVPRKRPKAFPDLDAARRKRVSLVLSPTHPLLAGLSSSRSLKSQTTEETEADEEEEIETLDDLYAFEDNEEEKDETRIAIEGFSPLQLRYFKSSTNRCVTAFGTVSRQVDSFEMNLSRLKMSDAEFKAIATSLVGNANVLRLDLSECMVNDVKVAVIIDLLPQETLIEDLILADNLLGGRILRRLMEHLRTWDMLTYLDISGNDLQDKDADMIGDYVQTTHNLRFLFLHRNNFEEKSGTIFGTMMSINESLVTLDVSWNCLRMKGVVDFLGGVKDNTTLERLNLAWNGLHRAGSKALRSMLETNDTLVYLNVCGNRFDGSCMKDIAMGLASNSTLERIELHHNPLLLSDISTFLTDLYNTETTNVKRVDLGTMTVEEKVLSVIDSLFWERNVDVRYGNTIGGGLPRDQRPSSALHFKVNALARVAKLSSEQRVHLVKYFGEKDMQHAVDTGEEIKHESFLYKMQRNTVTYTDLSKRIQREGEDIKQVIDHALDSVIPGQIPVGISRYSIDFNDFRKMCLRDKLRKESNSSL